MIDHDAMQTVTSYALTLANKDGYTEALIERALMRDPTILELQAQRGALQARATARRKAAWAVRHVAENPKDEWRSRIPARLVGYREAADAHPVAGRTWPTDRRVLETFYVTGTYARSDKFRFAASTIGDRTGMPWRTAGAAVGRLLGRGMIRKVGNHGEANGSRFGAKYQLAAPAAWNLPDRPSPPAPILPGLGKRSPDDALVRDVLRHQAFRIGADPLGDDGWLVVHWLDDEEPARPRLLSCATGVHYDRIRAVLGRLHRAGIARPIPDGWVRIPDAELLPSLDGFGEKTSFLIRQERGTPETDIRLAWWITWWASLGEVAPHAA